MQQYSPSLATSAGQSSSAAQAAIAVLVDLAQRGEINPWDVQVIEVIDRYLARFEPTDIAQDDPQSALPQSGQAFVWGAMLVLLKAQTLQQLEEPEAVVPLEDESVAVCQQPLPPRLEQYIHRRAAVPPPRRRRVTLAELIVQIQQLAVVFEQPSPPLATRRHRSGQPQAERQAAQTIAGLAHQENLTETAQDLAAFLQRGWCQLPLVDGWLRLEDLLLAWTRSTVPSPTLASKTDKVEIFWALLLLSAQSKVELSQKELDQDLQIRWLAESTVEAHLSEANSEHRV